MKTLISILLLAVFYNTVHSQVDTPDEFFEGEIIYGYTYEDRTGMMTIEQSKIFFGEAQKYTIKGGKYKSEFDGMMNMISFYNGEDTMFTVMTGQPGVMYVGTTLNDSKIISTNIERNVEKILDLMCDKLTIHLDKGTMEYYFNSSIGVDAKKFEKHKYGSWYECVKQSNALPLKQVGDFKDYRSVLLAKSVHPKKISDEEFITPKGKRVDMESFK